MGQSFTRSRSGERRAAPPEGRVIRFGDDTLVILWSSSLCHVSASFCVHSGRGGGWGCGCGWGQPKLTSLQSSVDGISELSRRRQSAVSWCSTHSPTLRSCVLHTSHSAAAQRPLHHASCRRLSVSSTRRPSATSLPTSPPGSRCLTSHG